MIVNPLTERPQILQREILKIFQLLQGKRIDTSCPNAGYTYVGCSDDYVFNISHSPWWPTFLGDVQFGCAEFSIRQLVNQYAKYLPTLKLLDLGAGYASFGKTLHVPGRIECTSVSAEDFRQAMPPVDANNVYYHQYYKILNIEMLNWENQFDFVVSMVTFLHLVDPIGALILAYNALKPGGVMMIHMDMSIPGIKNDILAVINYLLMQGHQLFAQISIANAQYMINDIQFHFKSHTLNHFTHILMHRYGREYNLDYLIIRKSAYLPLKFPLHYANDLNTKYIVDYSQCRNVSGYDAPVHRIMMDPIGHLTRFFSEGILNVPGVLNDPIPKLPDIFSSLIHKINILAVRFGYSAINMPTTFDLTALLHGCNGLLNAVYSKAVEYNDNFNATFCVLFNIELIEYAAANGIHLDF